MHLAARLVLPRFPIWKPGIITFVFSAFIWSICSVTPCIVSSEIWPWVVGWCCNVRWVRIMLLQILVGCLDSYVMPITWAFRILLRLCLSFLWNVEMFFPVALCAYEAYFPFWSLINCLLADMWNGQLWFCKGSVFSYPLFKKGCRQCLGCFEWGCFYMCVCAGVSFYKPGFRIEVKCEL